MSYLRIVTNEWKDSILYPSTNILKRVWPMAPLLRFRLEYQDSPSMFHQTILSLLSTLRTVPFCRNYHQCSFMLSWICKSLHTTQSDFFTSKTSIVILYVSFNWLLIQIILFTETPLQQVTLQNYNQLTWAKVNWNLYTLSSLTHTHTYTYVCGIKRRGISFWVTFVSDFGINIVKLL